MLKSSTATIILYVTRLCCRVRSYVATLLDYDRGTHETIVGKPCRDLDCAAGVREQLIAAREELNEFLCGKMLGLLLGWYQKLVRECAAGDNEEMLDRNTRHMCNLHAHMLLCIRSALPEELNEERVTVVVRGIIFLSTRHQWNRNQLDAKSSTTWEGWRIPETELYEVIQVLRRKLVGWLRTAAQVELDGVMNGVVRCSARSGSLLPSADEVPNLWAYISGTANRGRFTQYAIRNADQTMSAAAPVPEVRPSSNLAIVVDVQVMQMTLKASHPQSLPDAVAKMGDVIEVFGKVQCRARLCPVH